MMRPQTRYAKSGVVNIAFQVVGDGPFDLVFAPGFVSNVEFGWEEPTLEKFYGRLASFCRLIIFDKRGTGLSDRVSGVPDLETRMDDVRAIMDAAGSERAAVLGYSEGAAMAALFAATYPERTPARSSCMGHSCSGSGCLSGARHSGDPRANSYSKRSSDAGVSLTTATSCFETTLPRWPSRRNSDAGMRHGCGSARARARHAISCG